MTVQVPQVVTDREKLDYNLNLKDLIIFLALPILLFIVFHNMKSQLEKKGFHYEDKLRNNLKFLFSGIGGCVVCIVIVGFVIWKFLVYDIMTLKGHKNHYNVKLLRGYGVVISLKDNKTTLRNGTDVFGHAEKEE
jgi:hypothetical protein